MQTFDLIARKLVAHGGRARRSFQLAVTRSVERCASVDGVAPLATTVRQGLRLLDSAHAEIDMQAAGDPSALGAASYDLLTFYALRRIRCGGRRCATSVPWQRRGSTARCQCCRHCMSASCEVRKR